MLLSSHRNKQNIVEIETTLATQHSDEALLPPASSAASDISSNGKPTKQPTLPTEPKSRSTTPPQHAGAGTFRVGNTGTKARIQTKETGMPTAVTINNNLTSLTRKEEEARQDHNQNNKAPDSKMIEKNENLKKTPQKNNNESLENWTTVSYAKKKR